MSCRTLVRVTLCSVLIVIAWSPPAAAQSAVGTGPLTSSIADTEPTSGVISLGRLKTAPGMSIREIGWDDNVFDETESEHPKEDWVASVQPDVALFTRLRFVQLSAYGSADLTYYKKYEQERYHGYVSRARVDFLLSKIRPFVAGGQTQTRERPNGEIDVRADRLEQEASGGIGYDISPHAVFYGSAFLFTHKYEDALNRGINIGETLTYDRYNYAGGVKTDLTPLLSMNLSGSYGEDKFRSEPTRDSINKRLGAEFRIAPEAVITGQVFLGYQDAHFADPGVKPYRGVVGNAAIAWPILEVGRLSFTGSRNIDYSFDVREAYYVQDMAALSYSHRVYGPVDLTARVSKAWFDYSARATEPAHRDWTDTAAGSLGYNLRNRTRVALNYEYSRRRSPAFSDRNYQRRRAFLSWSIAF